MDDATLKRWFALESRNMNASLARTQIQLAELLRRSNPAVPTQGNDDHVFDPDSLASFATHVSPLMQGLVMLPIRFYTSHEHPTDVHVSDGEAAQVLVEADLVTTRPRYGKLWIGLGQARALAHRFPTVFQFVYR